MSAKTIIVSINYNGASPLGPVSRKRNVLLALSKLLRSMDGGSQYKLGKNWVVTQDNAVSASATVTVAAPTVGQTVTIAGTAMTAQQSRARATCTPNAAVAGNTLVLNGVTFTAVAGAAVAGSATFSIDTSDAATAISLSDQVNAYRSPKLDGLVTSFVSASGVVTFCAVAEGTSGNAITLTATATRLAVTGSGYLAGGAAVANNKFDFGSTNALVAASLARAINASSSAAIQKVSASVSDAVVTLTSVVPGVAGNAITLTSASGTTLAVTGSGYLADGAADAAVYMAF
jgi:hypothetical protein